MHRFWSSIIEPALSATQARSIVEIGAWTGKTTRPLLDYAKKHGGSVHCIDPEPLFDVAAWQKEYPGTLHFYPGLSLETLPALPAYDAVLIDGDHNWYTVFHELTLIAERAGQAGCFPLVLLHDVCWPYARRDQYYDPARIPEPFRKPFARKGILIEQDVLSDDGYNCNFIHAIHRGGPQNGVLTAIEDFLKNHEEHLRFVVVPGYFGLGILVDRRLLEKSPALEQIWHDLTLSTAIYRQIESLEHAHIAAETRNLRCYRDFRQSEQAALKSEQAALKLRTELARTRQTKSWRYTVFFRWLGKLFSKNNPPKKVS